MATIPGTNVAAMIVPFDDQDIFATHNDKYGRGGFRVCDTLIDRDAIPPLRRKAGMWVRVLSEGKVFELGSGLSNSDWVESPLTGAFEESYVALETVSGHRVMRLGGSGVVGYADATNPEHAFSVIGISKNAALAGESVGVAKTGDELIELSWAWVKDAPVYLGSGGNLIQSEPENPLLFSMIIGVATSPTSIYVDVNSPIFL